MSSKVLGRKIRAAEMARRESGTLEEFRNTGQEYTLNDSRRLHTGYPEMFGFEFHQREMERTAQLVPNSSPMLDLGCGSGLISHFIPSSVAYLGLDFNKNYLGPDWMGRDVDARVYGNILQLPVRDRGLKTVLLLHVIEHLPGRLQGVLLREIYRVMARGTFYRFEAVSRAFPPPHHTRSHHRVSPSSVLSHRGLFKFFLA
jgi:ubiquinone/menaquinone biosynthesis C-methylase UbiE